ncbi:MAG: Na/Pi cotransporter family protein [Bacteroidota bacterium]
MTFGLSDAIQILGSLALFIFGMKMMSEGVQRAAGSQLRNVLRGMTRNRYLGVFTGFLTTALVQSSSATTVMTVSFVNAGLLTLIESAGVMMGANIGTTVTGWLVSVLGFKIKLNLYSVPLFALGVPLLFSTRSRFKYWGEFIVGFSILFLGLSFLQEAVPSIEDNPDALAFLQPFTEWGFFSRLFFVLVGAVVTIVVQSSSAAMAVTLTMCSQGWLTFDIAAAMILGENIGTTLTAEVASLVGNVSARRSARIHSLFNIIGVTWMLFAMPYFLPWVAQTVQQALDIANPYTSTVDMPLALSAFHTFFNLTNVLVLIGFVPWLVRVASWSVPSRSDETDHFRLKFINSGIRTPELATVELQKETGHFGEVVSRMSGFFRELINATDRKKQQELLEKIHKYEKISDDMEIEITEYITRLSDQEITPKTSLRLRSILNVCNDLERIGDVYFQLSKIIEQKIENRNYFSPTQRNNINQLNDLTEQAFRIMVSNLQMPSYDDVTKSEAQLLIKQIDELRNQFRKDNLSRLGAPEYNVRSAMIYNNVLSGLKRVNDHVINVTESLVGEV